MALRALILATLCFGVNYASACATCSGPADAPQTQGMNAAILTLFGVFAVIALAVCTFVGLIAWRVRRYEAATANDDYPLATELSMES